MKVCDKCGSGGRIDRVELAINGRVVDRFDWCGSCERELYQFNHTDPRWPPREGFVKSTLRMLGIKTS